MSRSFLGRKALWRSVLLLVLISLVDTSTQIRKPATVLAEQMAVPTDGAFVAGLNAIVWQGSASEPSTPEALVNSVERAAPGLSFEVAWILRDGTWQFYLSDVPSAGTLRDLPVLASLFVVLQPSGLEAGAAPAPSIQGDWPKYMRDIGNRATTLGSPINTTNAAQLAMAWKFNAGAEVTGTPVVKDGKVYVGAWNGIMYALDAATGREIWRFLTDAALDQQAGRRSGFDPPGVGPGEGFFPYPNGVGIDATAVVVDETVYVPAVATMYALDARTGQLRWRAVLGDRAQGVHIWSSPVVVDGLLYIGVASEIDNPGIRGRLVALDAATGREVWTFSTVPEDADGGGIWSSPAVDVEQGLVIVGTANPYTKLATRDDYTDSIVALDWKTGQLRWAYQALKDDRTDSGFGSSPVLFDIERGAERIPAVGAPLKWGPYIALDRRTGSLLWRADLLSGPSFNPSQRVAAQSSAVVVDGKILLGIGTEHQAAFPYGTGRVIALDSATGEIAWFMDGANMVVGAAASTGSVLFKGGLDGTLDAFEVSTGRILQQWQLEGSIASGPAIVGGRVFVGAGIPSLAGQYVLGGRYVYSLALPGE